jgi:hypothetical protein
MRRRFFTLLAATLSVGLGLGGCAQTANTLVFGTNTSFGLSVGADVASSPGITVGYKRQEAVVLPLAAATEVTDAATHSCTGTIGTLPNSCFLQGRGGTDDTDSYSVLASFGAAKSGAAAVSTDEESIGAAEAAGEALNVGRASMREKIAAAIASKPGDISALLISIDQQALTGKVFQNACSGKTGPECAEIIKTGDGFDGLPLKKMQGALAAATAG